MRSTSSFSRVTESFSSTGGDLAAEAVELFWMAASLPSSVPICSFSVAFCFLAAAILAARTQLLLQLGGRLGARGGGDRPGERQGDGREDESGDELARIDHGNHGIVRRPRSASCTSGPGRPSAARRDAPQVLR